MKNTPQRLVWENPFSIGWSLIFFRGFINRSIDGADLISVLTSSGCNKTDGLIFFSLKY